MPARTEAQPTTGMGIRVAGVSKVFASSSGSVTAISDVSFDIAPGRVTALIGPSGCGKSTLLNMFAGLETPTSGSVEVTGGVVDRSTVGMMFQKSSLLPWRTAEQNVMLPAELLGLDRKAARARAVSLLELVGLGDRRGSYPGELSGGMQQRVALARVLLSEPQIILLDEPFGALDEMTREALDLEMCRIIEGSAATMVMVTHSIYEAVLVADTIVVLSAHPGRVAGIVDVTLDRPRGIEMADTELFTETVAEVRRLLRTGGAA
ncbi:ABC transporter ATP-binding protein [Mycolicibacterium vaccae]|uniref:ABC transporter ATP-binding protein n=1 Tax=Mycolicibacterium vaccae TaxID=1810 RepID=UPI003CF63207